MKDVSLLIALICVITFLVTATGCIRTAFAATVVEENSQMISDLTKDDIDVVINGEVFHCTYDVSYTSAFTGSRRDRYITGERGRIAIDPETGEVLRFFGFAPFDRIENINSRSDEELIGEVKARICELTELSSYNCQSVERFPDNGDKINYCQIKLFQQEGMELNNSVNVRLNSEGEIESYLKIAGCPEGTAFPEIADEELIALAHEAVMDKLGTDDVGKITINSKLLTHYGGRPALLLYVKAEDKQGFSIGIVPVVIFEEG
ncbi:MAG: hypothetical protein II191_05675 [Clostridia bacterium]|nr:hypothetical protein [Clostridia bacterium]